MTRTAASERQVQAADPAASTWLSANAGSGKTRVLTDRVARLLLNGAEPQRILCLTYTKAAASEMQNRLFRRLGGWAMLDEVNLRKALGELGMDGPVGADTLLQARRLFARAIETPGGLRIQTIHSFCASLLRRFPLEAGVSPQFTEMDDRAAKLMRAEIVEEMADHLAPDAFADLAGLFTGEALDRLTDEIARSRALLADPLDRAGALRLFGLPPGFSVQALLAGVFLGSEGDLLGQLIPSLATGKPTDIAAATRLRLIEPGLAGLGVLEDLFLFGETAKTPFAAKIDTFPTKDLRNSLGPLLAPLQSLMLRVEAARPRRLALMAAERTPALHRFAALFLPEYDKRKAMRGWLDFDDLIGKARALLTDPSVAQWVLFRLDGGIDHILVDEAQDTSPEQWRVIELLAQEFTAGRGTRDTARTIFVVGDKKQSIYSFQGADLEAFDAMKLQFGTRLAEVKTQLADLTLDYSFRSSPAILTVVDLTFDARRGCDLGGGVKHIAFKSDMPGRVDLWPALPAGKDPEPENWFDPTDLMSDEHPMSLLAGRIASEISGMIARGDQIPVDGGSRPVRAGDVLILVQRRSALFAEIIRACKAAGLPIAGADRLKLGAELAVRDLAALLSFLATPEDDLSLAAALRSPLFGWTEAQLYDLAQGRSGYLWSALRDLEAEHQQTLSILHDLRDQADFLRPFDLIERALTRHDGRRRLLARLGDEAEDGIDELLTQALAFERSEVPSLTGFLGWLQSDDVDVKRQMDSAGDRIRVMTVHGAKGLEAPIVFLPETQDRKAKPGPELLPLPEGAVTWRTATEESPALLAEAMAARRERAAAESLRQLYVAMTRAQSWLIVAGAGDTKDRACWHNIVRAGMEAAGAVTLPHGTLRYSHGIWPEPVLVPPVPAAGQGTIPDWALRPAPAADRPLPPLSPSDLGGAKVMPGEADPALEALAKQRGTDLHLLLEHLPDFPEADWPAVAGALVAGDPGYLAQVLSEATAVLADPALSALFAPDALAEVTITGQLGSQRALGTIDRLLVGPDRVLAVDYKSNRLVPQSPEAVPEGILRQMGAYAALLTQIYPDRKVEVAILWTATARLMPLPRALVMAALQQAGFP
jgi:ATP-dependent helicase/nuclease subunit A